jgi:hypothetical protein
MEMNRKDKRFREEDELKSKLFFHCIVEIVYKIPATMLKLITQVLAGTPTCLATLIRPHVAAHHDI